MNPLDRAARAAHWCAEGNADERAHGATRKRPERDGPDGTALGCPNDLRRI